MASDNFHKFDEKAAQDAIAAVRSFQQEPAGAAGAAPAPGGAAGLDLSASSGPLEIAAQCITVTVANKRVCLSLPLGIGKVCVPVPGFVPNGQAAQACISICTTFGIPTGVRLTVSVAGQVIVRKTFGKC